MKRERQIERRRLQSECVGEVAAVTCPRERDEVAEARRLEEAARPHVGRSPHAGLAAGLRAVGPSWLQRAGRGTRGTGQRGPGRESGL